jgi:hypothetical protein
MKETIRHLRRLQPLAKKRADALWFLRLTASDEREEREATNIVRLLANKNLNWNYEQKLFLPPEDGSLLSGEYPVGRVIYPEGDYGIFGLREDDWIKHVLITGMTGIGKTNTVFGMLRELKRKKKPFMVFDWKKSYRDLIQFDDLSDILVLAVGSADLPFRFNPLIPPPGAEPEHWLVKLVDVMKHAYFLGHGVEYLLRNSIDYLYREMGIYDGKDIFPAFWCR